MPLRYCARVLNLESLLRSAFPDGPSDASNGEYCLLAEALAGRSGGRWDEAISTVRRLGATGDVVDRLRAAHPTDRPHRNQFEDRFIDVFTECEAFARSADVAKLGTPRFVSRNDKSKSPDLFVEGWGWVEAKSIHSSDEDKGVWRTARVEANRTGSFPVQFEIPQKASDGFYKKVADQAESAVRQRPRPGDSSSARFGIFMHILVLDIPVFDDDIWPRIAQWASDFARTHGLRLVVCYNFDWRHPRIDVDFSV
jgi:hypothetical protein